MPSNDTKKKITDELLAFWEGLIFPYLEKRFGALEEDVAVLKDDVAVLKDDVATLKTDIMYVKSDLRDLKSDTPTDKEFLNHEKRIKHLENAIFKTL